jgi:hypothetical protein
LAFVVAVAFVVVVIIILISNSLVVVMIVAFVVATRSCLATLLLFVLIHFTFVSHSVVPQLFKGR